VRGLTRNRITSTSTDTNNDAQRRNGSGKVLGGCGARSDSVLPVSGFTGLAALFQGKRRPATEKPRAFSPSFAEDVPQTALAICLTTLAMEES